MNNDMKDLMTQHADEWRRAADREAKQGNTAASVTFRNMAWLVEHPEGWREFMCQLNSSKGVN